MGGTTEEQMALLSEQLHVIAEQLGDLAIDLIRSAIESSDGDGEGEGGGGGGPRGSDVGAKVGPGRGAAQDADSVRLERLVVRARRSVEKAAVLLDSSPRDHFDDEV